MNEFFSPECRYELKDRETTAAGGKCKGSGEWRVSDLILDHRDAFGVSQSFTLQTSEAFC